MNRKEAIHIIMQMIGSNPIIAANGYISRDLYEEFDRKENFYMIGSMGLASSIGLGVALKNPKIKVFVFDGDGNILMNLGSLATISNLKPKNFIHVIFDNHMHESTGGQPTITKNISLKKIAKSINFTVLQSSTKNSLSKHMKKINQIHRPTMLIVNVQQSKKVSTRVQISPTEIHHRFRKSLKSLQT